MNEKEVPQYEAPAYMGLGKALYALDDAGQYRLVRSAGWEAEEVVLSQAIEECERLAAAAHARCVIGEASSLQYYMYKRRMDVLVLAQSTGLFQWQVRRHLRAASFARLSAKTLRRYADALGMEPGELTTLPATP